MDHVRDGNQHLHHKYTKNIVCYSFLVKYFISNSRYLRNIETMIEKMVSGNGNSYEINIYGETELRPILPWMK